MYEWSISHWAKPLLTPPESEDETSPSFLEKRWRHNRNDKLRAEAHATHRDAGSRKIEKQVAVLDNGSPITSLLLFHPYDPYLVVANAADGISVWDFENCLRINSFSNGNGPGTRMTALSLINDCHNSLVVTGCDDGVVRIWGHVGIPPSNERLVTAFLALPSLSSPSSLSRTRSIPQYQQQQEQQPQPSLNRGPGLVLSWNPLASHLFAAGEAETIRIWDVEKERCVLEVPSQTQAPVTCMSNDVTVANGVTLVGCADGIVRIFDWRSPSSLAGVLADGDQTNQPIVDVHIQRGNEMQVTSASVEGEVRFWDIRQFRCTRLYQVHQRTMTAFAAHDYAPIMAGGSLNQFIRMMNFNGDTLSKIRYHDGFLGHQIGPVTCLAFHPHKLMLAAGATDSIVSLYASEGTS